MDMEMVNDHIWGTNIYTNTVEKNIREFIKNIEVQVPVAMDEEI